MSGLMVGGRVTPTGMLLAQEEELSAAWFAARRDGITGSDIAGILGMDRYGSPLSVYLDKLGERPDIPRSPELVEAAEMGRELEEFIARRFAARTGHQVVTFKGTLAHVDAPWMRANLDRFVVEGGDTLTPTVDLATALLECKNRSERQLDAWKDGVPDGPGLQTHWYLAVSGYQRAYVAVLVGGNKLLVHVIERDEELLAQIVDMAAQFRTEHVLKRVPPPIDGSPATAELLAHMHDVEPESVTVLDPADIEPLLERRAQLKADANALEDDLREVENRMKDAIGAYEIACCRGETAFTWKSVTSRRMDVPAFRRDHPDLWAEYAVPQVTRRLYVPKRDSE